MWHVEKHFDAFESLGKMRDNPYCIKCHTTGYNAKGGYLDEKATPQMKGVQCEACHGPGSEHIKAPKDKKSFTIKTHLDYENTCNQCHDKNWDPQFDYKSYRTKIEHWIKEKIPEYKSKP
jgi:hypothetical protein